MKYDSITRMRWFLPCLILLLASLAVAADFQVLDNRPKLDRTFSAAIPVDATTRAAGFRLYGQVEIIEAILDGREAIIVSIAGKQRKELARTQIPAQATQCSIMKAPGEIALACDDLMVAHSPLTRQEWSRLEYIGDSTAKRTTLSYQKIGSLYFSDNFMHGDNELGEWRVATGKWSVHSLNTPVRSANPFSFIGRGDHAEATTGYWFWRNYRFACAVQPLAKGGFGFRILKRDKSSYSLQWSPENGGELTFRKEVPAPLSPVTRHIPLQLEPTFWYQVAFSAVNGLVTITVDGQEILRYSDPMPLVSGSVSLCAEGNGAIFDDALVMPADTMVLEQLAASSAYCRRQNLASGDERYQLSGMELSNSTLSCRISDMPRGSHLILKGREGYGECVFARLESVSEGTQLRLGTLRSGREKEILSKIVELPSGEKQLALTLSEHEAFLLCNGRTLAIGRLERSWSGGAAIETGGGFIRISNLSWSTGNQMKSLDGRNEVFSHERSMSNWSDPVQEWVPAAGEVHYWHRNDFWGDVSVEMQSAPLRRKMGRFGVALGAQKDTGETPAVVALLVYSSKTGNVTFKCGQQEESRNVGTSRLCRFLALERRGDRILARINGELAWDAPVPEDKGALMLAGRIGKGDTTPWAEAVSVSASNITVDFFDQAPTAWLPVAGTWAVTNRWQCDPRWSFFSGVADKGVACLWSKYIHGRNFTIEYFVGPKMNRSKGGNESKYSADFNLAICCDGRDITSGYSVMFGGWKNRGTQLVRGSDIINENTASIIKDGNLHHHWFQVKVRRFGQRYTVWVDGKIVTDVLDDYPSTGNRFALWTWDNGVMIAQLRFSTDIPTQMAPPEIINRSPQTPY